MPSINQNSASSALPNFRNLGVTARILLGVIGFALAAALVRAPTFTEAGFEFITISAVVLPVLLLSMVILYLLQPRLARLPYAGGIAAVLLLVLLLVSLARWAWMALLPDQPVTGIARHWLLGALAAGALLAYFDLRGRALSPALAEARLQALQARIRPHFLFNSLNAVLALIRSNPRRAEGALEDLADLFRVVMADNRKLCTLEREVELARQYLQLEELRLGDRLKVEWRLEGMPGDALIPPLVLQPLLENAVYHGIEPSTQPGTVSICIYREDDQVHAVLRNPYQLRGSHHSGNKMALANIRERLALHFDAEARLSIHQENGTYEVHIVLPYLTEQAA